MKNILPLLVSSAFVIVFSVAIAADGDFEKADADTDGKLTFEEGRAVHSDWTEEAFNELDEDEDGTLSKEEHDAAMAAKSD